MVWLSGFSRRWHPVSNMAECSGFEQAINVHHIVSFLALLLSLLIEPVFYYPSFYCHLAVTHFLVIRYPWNTVFFVLINTQHEFQSPSRGLSHSVGNKDWKLASPKAGFGSALSTRSKEAVPGAELAWAEKRRREPPCNQCNSEGIGRENPFFCLGSFSLSAECNWNELVHLSMTLNGTAFLRSKRWGSLSSPTALLGSWEVVQRALTQLRAFSWELLLCVWLHLSGWDWYAWKGACPSKCCFKWKTNLFLS